MGFRRTPPILTPEIDLGRPVDRAETSAEAALIASLQSIMVEQPDVPAAPRHTRMWRAAPHDDSRNECPSTNSCGYCEYCRNGDLVSCKNQALTGVQVDGVDAVF